MQNFRRTITQRAPIERGKMDPLWFFRHDTDRRENGKTSTYVIMIIRDRHELFNETRRSIRKIRTKITHKKCIHTHYTRVAISTRVYLVCSNQENK